MLTRDELRELLPLYAGSDLEPELRLRVEAALQADPALRAELAPWTALEGLLHQALVPAPGAEAPRAAARVQCPVCKDALFRAGQAPEGGVPAVVCARCATPHHAGCFAQHGQCAVLGCGSARALGEAGAIALRPCGHCARETAAEAPFCAWCGAPQEAPAPAPAQTKEAPAPESALLPAPAARPRRLLAAAALLLLCGLSLGALLGVQQRALLEAVARESARVQLLESARELPGLLRELQAAQRAYRDEDLDGDGRATYAPDLGALLAALERRGRGGAYPHLSGGRWRPWFELDWGPPRDAESGRLAPGLDGGYQGRALPRFDPELGQGEHPTRWWAFDAAQVWEEQGALGGGEAAGALLARWRDVLQATPGVLSVAGRPLELERRVEDGLEPARVLRRVPRELCAALASQGLGLRVVTRQRQVAFWGPELSEEGQ